MKFNFFVLLFFIVFNTKSQDISESVKMMLYTSVVEDGTNPYNGKWENWIAFLENNYKNFEYKSSKWYSGYMPSKEGIDYYKYQIQIFKMPFHNLSSGVRYLLHYKDISIDVWLRVGGYVENDLKIFTEYLKKKSLKNKEIKKLFFEMQSIGFIYNELEWECLLNGCFKENTKDDCFKSVFYEFYNERSIGLNPLKDRDLNSCFSRVPLYGYIDLMGNDH